MTCGLVMMETDTEGLRRENCEHFMASLAASLQTKRDDCNASCD